MFEFQSKLAEIKSTYLNYGSQFWIGKKCNFCQVQFTLENYSRKEIKLVFSEVSKVDEYCSSERLEIKWYHQVCLARRNDITKELNQALKEIGQIAKS